MKSQINLLRQIQGLVLIRDEHQRMGDGSRLDPFNASISSLVQQLSPQAANIYDRLYKRNHVVVTAMANGICSACGMGVPTSQAQQVRIGEHLVTCTSCGRILYAVSADDAHNVAEKPQTEEIKNGISRFTAEELMITDLPSCDKSQAIAALAHAMQENRFIDNAEALISAALDREALLPTAMENGMAFPHVRGVEGGGLTFALGISPEGVDWDGQKVHVVFLTAIPLAVSAFYLNLVAGIVKSFARPTNYTALVNAKDAKALWKVLLKATRGYVK